MINKEQILSSLKEIYLNFYNVFGIEKEDFSLMIKRIISKLFNENFYKMRNVDINIFSETSLLNLKSFLLNLGLNQKQIKRIIMSSPAIILFSNNLDNIYAIFKNNEYKGYVLLGEDDYETYMYSDVLNNINKNNYVVDMMLASLEREDIKLAYDIIEHYRLKERFETLRQDDSVKNYYFANRR